MQTDTSTKPQYRYEAYFVKYSSHSYKLTKLVNISCLMTDTKTFRVGDTFRTQILDELVTKYGSALDDYRMVVEETN